VVSEGHRYRYIGPADVAAAVLPGSGGVAITSPRDFEAWRVAVGRDELLEPATFVVDLAGVLRLAPRRSEHVACAEGRDVLSAGEILFIRRAAGWSVEHVSNLSTGYCPDVSSWPAVASALDRAGVQHPGGFTAEFVFRSCPRCLQRNVIKDDDFFCAVCGSELPRA
jgi:hypothetical protein